MLEKGQTTAPDLTTHRPDHRFWSPALSAWSLGTAGAYVFSTLGPSEFGEPGSNGGEALGVFDWVAVRHHIELRNTKGRIALCVSDEGYDVINHWPQIDRGLADSVVVAPFRLTVCA